MLKVVVGFEPGIVKPTSFSDELAIRRTIVTPCAIFLYASCVLWTVQTLYELVLVIDMYMFSGQSTGESSMKVMTDRSFLVAS